MPSFVTTFLLPYVLPIVIQGLTPVLVEYIKVAADFVHGKLPASVNVAIASVVAEGVNQATQLLAGVSLPFGTGALVAIALNELGKDFGTQPPTPGATPLPPVK